MVSYSEKTELVVCVLQTFLFVAIFLTENDGKSPIPRPGNPKLAACLLFAPPDCKRSCRAREQEKMSRAPAILTAENLL